ncbi:MAG TPA: hypothetical protein VGM76_14325 [Lacipirellulaceae bacterium]|jgi:hypothetical protein
MDTFLQNVGDLPSPARAAVEGLIGHPLRDDQQLYIAAFGSSAEPASDSRNKSWDDLQLIISDMRKNLPQSGAPSERIEQVIDEECDAVRYGN